MQRFLALAAADSGSPLQGCAIEDVVASDGRLARGDDESRGQTYAEILERHGLDELTADGDSGPSRADTGVIVGSLVASRLGRFGRTLVGASHATVPAGAFGARFAEVRVDPELGALQIARIVLVTELTSGIINRKLAGGPVVGRSSEAASACACSTDDRRPGSGRSANATLANLLVGQ